MKSIVKGASSAEFEYWKAQANDAWQPGYDELQNPQKRRLHEALLIEQGRVCCYCGRSISLGDSHIEHFRPQEQRADLALDFANLHASCIRELAPGAPLHCGHAKANHFDESLAVSPLEVDCERRFIYSPKNGAIYPADRADQAVAYMVELLQLDISFLRDRRAQALGGAFDDQFVASASNEELEALARGYRQPDGNGQLSDFGHALARYAEQLLGHAV